MPAEDRPSASPLRLKAEVWIKAYLRKLDVRNIWGAIVRKGDPDAGVIYVCVNRLDRRVSIYGPAIAGAYDADGERQWSIATRDEYLSEAEAAEFFWKQGAIDPDFWVVEVESPSGDAHLDGILDE